MRFILAAATSPGGLLFGFMGMPLFIEDENTLSEAMQGVVTSTAVVGVAASVGRFLTDWFGRKPIIGVT